MSSTTPENGDGSQSQGPAGQDGSQISAGDRAAIRTSLAERFAAAKGVEANPVVPRPDETSATAADASPVSPAGVSGGTAPAPGYVPPAPAQTSEPTWTTAPTTPRTGSAERPSARPAPAGPRKVRLSVARVDPWSVMKLSFLLSIAVGIGIIVAAAAMWLVLDSMHVFSDVEELLVTLDSDNFLRLMDYVQFDRVISMAAIIAVVDILLLTALSTLGAFLYNIVAALVGGLHLTLTDD